MPTIKVNDINMYYETYGSGDPLVLIAGLGTDLTVYKQIISLLSQEFKVLAFDNRGAGRTDKPDMPYSIEMLADDTAQLMSAVGIEKAHVLGHSMGGRIAMALSLQHPGKVNGLILASTSANIKTGHSLRPILLKMASRIGTRLKKYPQPYYAFKRQLEASQNYDCSDQLNKITMPTLIIHGKKDKLTPYKFAEEMYARIKGSKIITFTGGHYIFLIESMRFTEVISEFLRVIPT